MSDDLKERPPIRIGSILRARRKELGLTLDQVAERIGVTKGFLSEVEREKTSPSVASLLQICRALQMSVGELFPTDEPSIIRRDARSTIKFGGQNIHDYVIHSYPNSRFQALISYMDPGGGGGEELYTIDSQEEFVFVLAGKVRIVIEGEETILDEGDSMTFNPRREHTFMNASETEPAQAIFVVSPSPAG